MDSRMNRYDGSVATVSSRTEKNKKLYDQVADIDVEYIDINTDNVLEIDSQSLANRSRSDYQKRKEFENIVTPKEEKELYEEIPIRKDRVYDIDEILRKAKETNIPEEQKKRLINTEYNILTKLDIDDINKRDLKEEDIKQIVQETYPEPRIIDDNQDLFHDMIEDKELEKEITKEILNKEVENVFEDTEAKKDDKTVIEKTEENTANTKQEELEEDKSFTTTTQIIKSEKKSKAMLVFVIIAVLLLLAMGGYLFFKYFGTL